jgi:hypothetical protein
VRFRARLNMGTLFDGEGSEVQTVSVVTPLPTAADPD